MKKKTMVLGLVLVCALVFAGIASAHTLDVVSPAKTQKITTDRTPGEYVKAMMSLMDADKAGDIVYPEENEIKYPFVPLYKGGELIGYGTWVNTIIYSHPEDFIAVIAMDGDKAVVKKWKPLDANDHHPEMKQEEYLSRYYGMSLETSFNPDVDIISGSTLSCQTFFFEMKNALLVFQGFGPGAEE